MRKGKRVTGIEASAEARKLSCAILEVLGGLRGPTEAAEALGVSLPRYYILEARALEGLVKALEPREKGRREARPEDLLAEVSRERDRLRSELERARALARMSQKAAGLSPASEKGEGKEGKPKKGKRRAERARRLVMRLKEGGAGPEPSPAPAAEPCAAGDAPS